MTVILSPPCSFLPLTYTQLLMLTYFSYGLCSILSPSLKYHGLIISCSNYSSGLLSSCLPLHCHPYSIWSNSFKLQIWPNSGLTVTTSLATIRLMHYVPITSNYLWFSTHTPLCCLVSFFFCLCYFYLAASCLVLKVLHVCYQIT